MLLALTVTACWTPPSPPPPEPPPAPEEAFVWVHASLLRLRAFPNADAAWSPLSIGTRLRIVGREGPWLRVIAPDGRTGWVSAEFVGEAPLTLAQVRTHLTAADPAERVMWFERAAALAPTDPELLTGLVAAYKAVGRPADAANLEAALAVDEGDRFDRWFPTHRAEVAAITEALPKAQRADELLAVWRRARDVTAAMGEPLGSLYDGTAFVEGDPTTMLHDKMPWATLALYAEGTVPALELGSETWTRAATTTPEGWDDAFFSLVTRAYANASARGWTSWQVRNWDYGGCSPFGDGKHLHLDLLKATDALAQVLPVVDVVAEIRRGVLADIDKTVPDEFPYCLQAGKPTPVEGLVAEARAILAEVNLTAEEKQRITARIEAGFQQK